MRAGVAKVCITPPVGSWQGGYGAFTISKSHVPRVLEYVLNQERHHAEGSIHHPLEPAG